ncbi:helix-turn-helix transcriptional regulator [Kibdelosporangium phytohabitans]|uniref:DNA-binding transcriptional regulator n=1 Tax=Kibdelosporangium phytohabitans TaxID=860235 RepID=A0A0N9I127_9PSEU|nr:YafY family protein [Kibdelosporangium phytohabitans]ALG12035.1 DNA-binding transcriptional regulator [Kibdelosporangium phytohabitans]MBE1463513.1 putative DNA-binding transcriptional regulator YafY [Kibdelosporangium phytohabitans]
MTTTAARLLRLLGLLQQPRDWSGPQLAERLDVSSRTVRNDVERLRSLGYPIAATPGVAGGYRLGGGASMPPLLLDDDEAIAVTVGLRTATSVSGIEEAAERALSKLDRMLPTRLRYRVGALQESTVSIPHKGPVLDSEVLTAIATAIRTKETLRFHYQTHDGTPSSRSAEPHQLAHTRGRWYLLAWDTDRADWRTFRADRITPRTPNGPRFTARPVPGGDVVDYLKGKLDTATWRYRANVTVYAPAEHVVARLPPSVVVEPVDEQTCRVNVGSDNPRMLALWLGMLDADFEVTDSVELADELNALAGRYQRATAAIRATE